MSLSSMSAYFFHPIFVPSRHLFHVWISFPQIPLFQEFGYLILWDYFWDALYLKHGVNLTRSASAKSADKNHLFSAWTLLLNIFWNSGRADSSSGATVLCRSRNKVGLACRVVLNICVDETANMTGSESGHTINKSLCRSSFVLPSLYNALSLSCVVSLWVKYCMACWL